MDQNIVSRKKQRQLQRKEKKKRKDFYYHRRKQTKNQSEQDLDKELNQMNVRNQKKKKKQRQQQNPIPQQLNHKKSLTYINHQRRLIRIEEKEIKKYEKLLKLKSYTKRKKLPKSFHMDGLADLIEFCDGGQRDEDAKQINKIKNQKSHYIQKSSKEKFKIKFNEFNSDNNNDDEQEEDFEDSDNENLSFEENNDDDKNDINEPNDDKKEVDTPELHEDIYGFLRDKYGNIVKRENEKDNYDKNRKEQFISEVIVDENLQRKLRGLLNRLTSSNIKVISKQIIDLNQTYSRYVINKGIMNCLDIIIIGAEHNLPSKLVAEIAMLIAILYFEMNEDVGGFFIHSIICRFDAIFNDNLSWESTKKLNNILALILNIYSTGMIDCQLIYDIINKFCDKFDNEKSIEIIDLILKTSGFMLRKENASKMKSLVLKIQTLSQSVQNISGNRMKFMLESLTAIKNNNISKIRTNEAIVKNDLIEATLKGVIKKTRVPSIPGQYSAILQSSHWFSYTKEILPLKSTEKETSNNNLKSSSFMNTNVDYSLRDRICKALRINTPLRRDLFTALFSCTDYLDAAGKLISIGKKQSSEIINVVLHVAINEKVYNNFYFYLLQHLSNCDRKYKLALDFAIRDKITDLESLPQNNRSILQKLIFTLLKNNCLSITCLKVIQFSDMNEIYVNFIRNILQPLFEDDDDKIISSILSKIPKKDNFASAIKLFISCFMSGNIKSRVSSIQQLQSVSYLRRISNPQDLNTIMDRVTQEASKYILEILKLAVGNCNVKPNQIDPTNQEQEVSSLSRITWWSLLKMKFWSTLIDADDFPGCSIFNSG